MADCSGVLLTPYYGGCDPGESAGFACLYLDRVHLSSTPMYFSYTVLAVEGQYVAGKRGAYHKGRRTAVHHKTVPTLAFRAGRLSVLAGSATRVLRCAPEVWRTLLGYGGLSAEVCIARLRRKLGPLTGGSTDDAVEAYGLALVAQLVGDAKAGPGWVAKKQDDYGWWDVTLTKPKAVRPVGAPVRKRKARRVHA